MDSPNQKQVRKTARGLWLWVALAFLILIAAWTALIVVATENEPETIEVETP